MSPNNLLDELKSNIQNDTDLKSAITTFINHFATTEVDGCSKDNDGDMLLFQWDGPHRWNDYFTINLTRQFTHTDENEEYLFMEHLQLNYHFDAKDINLEAGNEWFDGSDILAFTQRVLSSKAVTAVKSLEIKAIEFDLCEV